RFDGIPEKILVKKPEEINDLDNPAPDDELNDEYPHKDESLTGDGEDVAYPEKEDGDDPETGGIPPEAGGSDYIKYRVAGVTVKKLDERVQYYDADGKLVTESFKDYTRKAVKSQFQSLDEFVNKWNATDRKQAVMEELEEHGVIWEALRDDVGRELDAFDLICHVVFDQPPLTRRER